MTCLTVCVVPLGSVTDSPMRGTAKKLQVCSVSIDWWPRYTVHEIVIEGAYRAELTEIALCPMPGYSTTAMAAALRLVLRLLLWLRARALHLTSAK